MGIKTDIGWCDSSLNAQAGCQGCELWTAKTRICYAGTLTERYGGRNGWPDSFDKPKIFPERVAKACNWPDMRGVARPDKPWIKTETPRLIFLDAGEFLSWLDEFTDPNAEKRKRLQSLVEQASDLDMEIRKLRDEIYEDDNLPF